MSEELLATREQVWTMLSSVTMVWIVLVQSNLTPPQWRPHGGRQAYTSLSVQERNPISPLSGSQNRLQRGREEVERWDRGGEKYWSAGVWEEEVGGQWNSICSTSGVWPQRESEETHINVSAVLSGRDKNRKVRDRGPHVVSYHQLYVQGHLTSFYAQCPNLRLSINK